MCFIQSSTLPQFNNRNISDAYFSSAITEDEFYGHPGGRPRASTKGSSHSHDSSHYPGGGVGQGVGTSAPPSPKSLQPPDSYQTVEENGHKKLNYCSSLSAPEVNQVCMCVCA